jgi:hypothetical protein
MKRILVLCVLPLLLFGCPGANENDSCQFANDGECDDGRAGAVSAVCDPGTDATDCVGVTGPTGPNDCIFANDGECDDGRAGADSSACPAGSDENDCAGTPQ